MCIRDRSHDMPRCCYHCFSFCCCWLVFFFLTLCSSYFNTTVLDYFSLKTPFPPQPLSLPPTTQKYIIPCIRSVLVLSLPLSFSLLFLSTQTHLQPECMVLRQCLVTFAPSPPVPSSTFAVTLYTPPRGFLFPFNQLLC